MIASSETGVKANIGHEFKDCAYYYKFSFQVQVQLLSNLSILYVQTDQLIVCSAMNLLFGLKATVFVHSIIVK
jgi:hypothetical protein